MHANCRCNELPIYAVEASMDTGTYSLNGIRVRIDGGVGGVKPSCSSGLDPPSSDLDPPDLFVFLMYFVHEFGSTPLALGYNL